MIEIKFTGESLSDLRVQIERFLADGTAKPPAPVSTAPEPVAEVDSGPFVAAKAPEDGSGSQPTEETFGAKAAEIEPSQPTYDTVRAVVLSLADIKGKDATVAMLRQFGAARASEVDPSLWADVVAAAQALIEGA